jgi:hypothetical protein
MKISTPGIPDRLNHHLARLLGVGSWASCGLIAAGMVLQVSGARTRLGAEHLIFIGIVLLIALPTMRVAAMVVWYLFRRDLEFAVIAALVLAVIVASTLLGVGAG